MKNHSHLSKHELHQELKQEAIAEFLGEQEEFHRKVHTEANHHFKRFLLFFSGVLLLSLFISFAILSPVNAVIEGQLRSSKLNNNIVNFGDYSIYFSMGVSDILSSLYSDNQITKGVESAYCLEGEKVGSRSYRIDNIFYPTLYDQSRSHVSFSPCPDDTVVMLHTHPYKSCLASDTDLNTLAKAKKVNKDVLMVIMCEEMRFSVYS